MPLLSCVIGIDSNERQLAALRMLGKNIDSKMMEYNGKAHDLEY